MTNLLRRIMRDGWQRKKAIALFILLIFLSIILNIYFIHSRTIEIVKEEKIIVLKNVLKKNTETVELKLADIAKSVREFTDNLGVGASIVRYNTVAPNLQEKINNYITEKLKEIVESNYYIDDAICYTKDGRVYSAKGLLKFNDDILLEGLKYRSITTIENEEILFNTKVETELGVDDKGMILFRNVYHLSPPGSEADTSKVIANNGTEDEVGYIFAYINKDRLIDLYNNNSEAIVKDNELVILNEDLKPMIGQLSITMTNDLIRDSISKGSNIGMKETVIDNRKMVLGISKVEPVNWYIVSLVPVNSLIQSTRSGLRGSVLVLGLISVVVSFIIIIQALAFSKTIVEKEIVDYRLSISEEVNDKLRLYKHDFMNHLQIIQGLLQMGYPERAMDYLKNVVKEGTNINTEYEIGIPELEVTLNSIICQARKENIEVEVEATEITDELPITINELIKIIMNLTNNAMYALTNCEEEHKLLKIKIKYDLGNYVFEVCNNTPIIPESIRQDIFKKGFSTKGERGNGLGLYIIKRVLNKYEGTIDLVVDKEGNRFIVTIPDSKELSII